MRTLNRQTEMTPELLRELIREHSVECIRLDKLYSYYNNHPPIVDAARKPEGKPDNRIAINHAKYIVDTFSGFFSGIPIKTTHEDTAVGEYIEFVEKSNDLDDNLSELARLCDIFGLAYELVFMDEQGLIGLTYIDPREAFIVYDDTVRQSPLFGVRWGRFTDRTGARRLQGTWSDSSRIVYFREGEDGGLYWSDDDITPHYFGGVPIIEYSANDMRSGLYEPALSAMDAYNRVLSEKANDVDYFADAYLTIIGASLDDSALKHMRENRIINLDSLDDRDIVVDFLARPESDKTQENLLNRLEKKIYQTTMVANIDDDVFRDTSGEALKYKLHAMDTLAATKERKFTSAMTLRWRLIANVTPKLPKNWWIKIQYRFTRNLPSNLMSEAETAAKMIGVTSRGTALSVLSCVDNVDQELVKIDQENAKLLGFGDDYGT